MKVKFFTLGCKVNQYETQGLREKFLSLGHEVTKDRADLYVINTCTVTHRADVKSKDAVLRAKKENPKAKVVVCGCLAQLNKEFIDKMGVDYVIAQDKKHLLPNIVLGLPEDKNLDGAGKGNLELSITHFHNQRAFVKVQDGCDNLCSFCKIPHLRGPSRSKDKEIALKEIRKVSVSHKEIVLCGVNLSLYGCDLKPPCSLNGLIEEILNIDSLARLRLSSLEPFFVDKALFSFMKNPKLCPHFHFPFQYGDDRVLGEMNKKERVALYETVVFGARKVSPDVAISCDIMVGFPYEDDHSFQNTVDFIKRVKPMRMHIFTFSPREKTKFFQMKAPNQQAIGKRYQQLKILADKFSDEYKNRFLGKTLNMVAEEQQGDYICGYTQNYIRVFIKDKVPLGEIVPVRIKEVKNDKVIAAVSD